ncbi:MAG: hypothetical protein ACRQFF_08410 [Sphaerochaeta sp.]
MKKSTRVSLLVFTIVAAIAAFGVLWYTRPGAPTYVLDEAKARQNVPLLEVQEPAIQQPPVEIDLDYDTITAKVKQNLVEDDGFSTVMAQSVSSSASNLVDKKIDSFRDEIDTKLDDQNAKLYAKIEEELAANTAKLMKLIEDTDMYQTQIDTINDKISSMSYNLEAYAADVNDPSNYSVDITDYIPQIVDSILPQVTTNVLDVVADNKEAIFSDIYSMSENKDLSAEDAQLIYETYRDNLVKDITPQVLDSIEKEVNANISTQIESAKNDAIAEFSKQSTVTTEATAEMAEAAVATKPAPVKNFEVTKQVDSTGNVIVPSKPTFAGNAVSEKTVRTNTIRIIATSDGSGIQDSSKDRTSVVKMPSFSSTPTVTVMDPAVYNEMRSDIRQNAINDILDMIN